MRSFPETDIDPKIEPGPLWWEASALTTASSLLLLLGFDGIGEQRHLREQGNVRRFSGTW